ncbi:GAF domain-containing protein [Oculatella sp. LEGE 06141]|uniref:sensor histidine kinase n=1 Tax=Oculatella sp. LEGE 06141 TaxID=1828648 RepID=UPI0018827DAB|nr:GAF domain-containing protein [Oculatella sp. LEGE 06141]MBE9180765.1 GAF domain-containing protein [Oculatella sp. LEGE 06141]
MGSQKEPSTYEKQLVALGRTLQALREEENSDALIEITLQYLQVEFNYALIWIGLYDRVEHRLAGKGGVAPSGDAIFLKQRFTLNPGDLLEQVVIQQRPIGVPDLREESRAGEWRRAAQKHQIQGTIIFPIRHKDRCLGVTLLGSLLWGTSPHSEEKARLSMLLGALAEALYQLESDWQRQQTKRPAEPLLVLLSKLRSLPTLKQRLEAIIDETHRFINPDRTNVYWFEAERRYFWRRLGNRDKTGSVGEANPPASGIAVQEVSSFYQALAADQLVSIGEAHSSLKADITGRLMQQIQARSLLAAPVLFQNELLGFLAVEGSEARIWSEEEKNYVRGAAQLVALTAPLERMEETVQQIKLDQSLTAEITRAIYSEDDWNNTLKKCAQQICQRLRAERFLVLLYNNDQEAFEICYQTHPTGRRPITTALEKLNGIDWQMLERSTEAVGIENLEEDLKLMAWRQVFLDAGVRSLLVCSTATNHPLEGILVIGQESTRAWNRSERDILRVVSQQVGLILHQWHLQRENDQQHKVHQTIQWGLTTMQQTHDLERLQRSAMQHIAQVLQVPLATLITWQPGRKTARLETPVFSKKQFGVTSDITIPIYTDVLIQSALQADGLLPVSIDAISPETRQWLSGSDIGQILVMALRTAPEHEPTGVVLVADHLGRCWVERQLNAFGTLASQLAWCRRYLSLTDALTEQRKKLEQLNWYKQSRLEEIYRTLGNGVRRLNEVSHQKDAVSSMRFHQILRQFGNMLSGMAPILKHEQWQLHNEYETIPLASLLKRSLERVDSLIKQRQLWSQVHNDNSLNIGGDVIKIELVLYELLTAACRRSPASGRLDIWCRPLDTRWLELSITDNGVMEPRLIEELNTGRPDDLLAPSTLDQPPGLHLAICQLLMQQIGGEFSLYKLEDGRVLSRLVLPIAAGTPITQRSQTKTGSATGFFE